MARRSAGPVRGGMQKPATARRRSGPTVAPPTRGLVAAIDFGTTYSGVAFSSKKDFSRDKLKVTGANFTADWQHGQKVPTAILFDPDRKFHSFGLEAEDHFSRLTDQRPAEAATWLFFHRFKMVLYDQRDSLSSETTLLDFSKRKTMPALVVFSAAIGHLRRLLVRRLEGEGKHLDRDSILWVLTIPAIWEDGAKQFMREAAIKGGVPKDHLTLAFEPEAATIYCRVLSEKAEKKKRPLTLDIMAPNTKFMVVDSGGGTLDVTVYEVSRGGKLRELYHPSGGNWGGTSADKAWMEAIKDAVGIQRVVAIKRTELVALNREFEASKRRFQPGSDVIVKIPSSVKVIFTNAKENKGFRLGEDSLIISSETFSSFFSSAIQHTVEHIRSVLALPQVGEVRTILLVGGFSQSPLLREAIRSAFQTRETAVTPLENASTAICMGAVLFGHDPSIMGWRASPYTYGVETTERFVEGRHDPALERDGRCRGIFNVFIRKGDIVSVGQETPPQAFKPLGTRQVVLEIYRSSDLQPRYVRDCQLLGKLSVALDPNSADDTTVVVTMVTGCVELRVKARDQSSGREYEASLDFLSR